MTYIKADHRKKVIFLGTPQVAAEVLKVLLQAQNFIKIVLVVSQPPARHARGGLPAPSAVHALAYSEGIPVLTPQTAKDPSFLEAVKLLSPDLCITAAYGQFLPQNFISLPQFGTLNIHPSLLPLYRGAAPVQRALEKGEKKTGVSILRTVLAMDAGPIVAQEEVLVNETIKSSDLLNALFIQGGKLLVKILPRYFEWKVTLKEQDEALATKADKIKSDEGVLDFSQPARVLHNKVRAFSDWPTTKASFILGDKVLELKIVTTRVVANSFNLNFSEVSFSSEGLCVCCGDDQILEILELQLPGKKVISARDFKNGIHGKLLQAVV